MSRVPLAVLIFVVGFTAYIVVVVTLADLLEGAHWLAQATYYLVTGAIWAWPTRALMVWAARK